MDELIEKVAIRAVTTGFGVAMRKLLGQQIRITYPRTMDVLSGGEPLGGGSNAYEIRGELKRLPAGHQIWLLVEDEPSGSIWPQAFEPVQYDRERKAWVGRINGTSLRQIRVIAVVAPPTSQDFFRYYQDIGKNRDYHFQALKRIPPECINQDSVQVRVSARDMSGNNEER